MSDLEKKQEQLVPATIFHASDPEACQHVVGVGNLRVMISQEAGSWIAQGLEIDYFAQGGSLQDVQTAFQRGLRATIDEHLKLYGGIQNLLVVAPRELWHQFLKAPSYHLHSQIGIHETVPFAGIDFYKRAA